MLGAWELDNINEELRWHLPASKSDHLALGVTRSWPCICGFDNLSSPYHIALEHAEWLSSTPHFRGDDTPISQR